jgi:hypothetical protein
MRTGVAGLVVVAALVGIGASGCNPQKTQPVVSPSGSSHPIEQSKQQYTEAVGRAHSWQKNAVLERVYRSYSGTLTPGGGASVTFAFSSLADPEKTFEVAYTGDKTTERKVAKQGFELNLIPIDTAEWQVDPETALQKAEAGGGRTFREQHLAGFKVLEQMAKTGSHPLQWYFRYDTGDGSHKRLELWLNAKTGAVSDQKESAVTAG